MGNRLNGIEQRARMVSTVKAPRTARERVEPDRRAPRKRFRPLRRVSDTFLKLLYRYTHSSAYRHNERLACGVKIERDTEGRLCGMTIRGHRLTVVNSSLTLPLDGAGECHLIAAGPSVNDIDYSALPMPCTMGVNGAIALQDLQGVQFDYYTIIDSGFVRNRPDLVDRVISQPLTLFAPPLVLWHIAQRFSPEHIRCRVFLLDDVRFPAGRRAVPPERLRSTWSPSTLALFDTREALGFSLDVRHGLMDGCTVAYSGLQVVVSLGFRRIFLHGVDLTDAQRTPRFYERTADMQPSTLDRDFKDFIEPSFRNASALLRRRGVEVYNLSVQSALAEDIFPKVLWRSLVTGDAPDMAERGGCSMAWRTSDHEF
ncbi:KDO transferase-3 [Paraburkholderia caballeronis]|uniref:hypothetical protein n=1 Tax=Paraburkholderia caballeronis TaxID=416943 RepID=UPI001066F316|nr:hypothetical protein [Paraburkholderia caballeronis]TDV39057.1 KDO transferase-3 [Paraburkholderia caballeronis]